ncbi:hypothetical protein JT359_17940 [Candidatus Poribacteria bacterium]|nr:hypothetical protein [Candidatus Poribacteria bacterium]
MKRKSKLHSRFLAFIMLCLIFYSPFVSFALQNTVRVSAIAAAEQDAAAQVNKSLWFFGGCLGGILVIILANIHEPYPPASSLLGKTPEYVSYYTDAFRAKARNLQTSQAMRGCAANCIVVAGCYGCMIINMVLEESYY